MGDMGDMYRDMKAESKHRRENNRKLSRLLLDEAEITYKTNNYGAHLVVQGIEVVVDFWPGTGRWTVRKGVTRFGVHNLIKFIRGGM